MATSSIKSSDFRQKVGGQWTLDTDMQVGFRALRLPRAPSAAAQSLSPPTLCAQLLQFLEEFKDKMVMRTTEVTREVDELVHEVKVCFSSSPIALLPLRG